MRIVWLTALALALLGCDARRATDTIVDQCLRTRLFQQCLTILPKGPTTTTFNDWKDVVSQCESSAYYQSKRVRPLVPSECVAE
jgi:hypothetical protein